MTVTLKLEGLEGQAPLYRKFANQSQPQPAYITMDEDGEVATTVSGEIGTGAPAAVVHGVSLRWRVPSEINGQALAKFVEAKARPLLERIHAGHSVEWRNGNHTGTLTDDAREADEALDRLIEDDLNGNADVLDQVWQVADWLSPVSFSELWPATVTLDEAVADLQAVAASERVTLEGDLRDELIDRAVRMLTDGTVGLTRRHLDALLEETQYDEADVAEYIGNTGERKLGPAGEAAVLDWLAAKGRGSLVVSVLVQEIADTMADRAEDGEGLIYELGMHYTTTGGPEILRLTPEHLAPVPA